MKKKTIVVAYNKNFAIGDKSGNVPWHIPEDLKFFREFTMGKVCIMGRKTWDSVPKKYKPLPGRQTIVVTHDPEKIPVINSSMNVVSSIEEAITIGESLNKDICIVGGGQIYECCLKNNLVDEIMASEIKNHVDVEQYIFFPNIIELGWIGSIQRQYKDFEVLKYKK